MPGTWVGTSWVRFMILCSALLVTNEHLPDGYEFLMQNCRFLIPQLMSQLLIFISTDKAGDRICIFGFSRGAYTARALAGMIHKVCIAFSRRAFVLTSPYVLLRWDCFPRAIISRSRLRTKCSNGRTKPVGSSLMPSKRHFQSTSILSLSAFGKSRHF